MILICLFKFDKIKRWDTGGDQTVTVVTERRRGLPHVPYLPDNGWRGHIPISVLPFILG